MVPRHRSRPRSVVRHARKTNYADGAQALVADKSRWRSGQQRAPDPEGAAVDRIPVGHRTGLRRGVAGTSGAGIVATSSPSACWSLSCGALAACRLAGWHRWQARSARPAGSLHIHLCASRTWRGGAQAPSPMPAAGDSGRSLAPPRAASREALFAPEPARGSPCRASPTRSPTRSTHGPASSAGSSSRCLGGQSLVIGLAGSRTQSDMTACLSCPTSPSAGLRSVLPLGRTLR